MKQNASRSDVLRLISEGRLRVSEDGTIEARRQGGPMRPIQLELVNAPGRSSQYARASFCGFRALAHRVVWWTFRGELGDGEEIDHVNGNKLDNRLTNLDAVTRAENARRAIAAGLSPVHKPKNWSIDEKTVHAIRAKVAAGAMQSDVAKELGLKRNVVNRVVRGRTYRSV